MSTAVPVLGLAAFSGAGKTTLLQALIPLLAARHLRVAVIKTTHHAFDIDTPGKDSHRLRQAGATQTLLASPTQRALMVQYPQPQSLTLASLLNGLEHTACDLVLVEGLKDQPFAKIELHRPSLGKPLLQPDDPHIIAVASDLANLATGVPLLPLNQPPVIAEFIAHWHQQQG